MDKSRDQPIIDEYLDCTGQTRRFRLELDPPGFLEAFEIRENDEPGLRFIMSIKPDVLPPWGDMRDHIRDRLSQRDLVRDKTGKLDNIRNVIRAQIHDLDSDRSAPMLVVDDMRITWDELGQVLMPYSGWGLRIQICDCGDE